MSIWLIRLDSLRQSKRDVWHSSTNDLVDNNKPLLCKVGFCGSEVEGQCRKQSVFHLRTLNYRFKYWKVKNKDLALKFKPKWKERKQRKKRDIIREDSLEVDSFPLGRISKWFSTIHGNLGERKISQTKCQFEWSMFSEHPKPPLCLLIGCLLTFPKEDVQGKNRGDKIKQVKILRTLLYIEVIS